MQARLTMQGKVCLFLFILFYLKATVPAGETPDLYKNQLHFGCGINYKYNGKLYHNLDRVWVVHRVVIPQTHDLTRLPDFPDTVNCIPHVKDKEMQLYPDFKQLGNSTGRNCLCCFACLREIGNFGHRGVRSLSSKEEK